MSVYLVEVVEACFELLQLCLRDALGLPGHDLVLQLIHTPRHTSHQLLPTDTQHLQHNSNGVVAHPVVMMLSNHMIEGSNRTCAKIFKVSTCMIALA